MADVTPIQSASLEALLRASIRLLQEKRGER